MNALAQTDSEIIKMQVSPRVFDPIYTSRARYNLIYGGAGAGKSYAMTQVLLLNWTEPEALLYDAIAATNIAFV